jgi:hypothetical protein
MLRGMQPLAWTAGPPRPCCMQIPHRLPCMISRWERRRVTACRHPGSASLLNCGARRQPRHRQTQSCAARAADDGQHPQPQDAAGGWPAAAAASGSPRRDWIQTVQRAAGILAMSLVAGLSMSQAARAAAADGRRDLIRSCCAAAPMHSSSASCVVPHYHMIFLLLLLLQALRLSAAADSHDSSAGRQCGDSRQQRHPSGPHQLYGPAPSDRHGHPAGRGDDGRQEGKRLMLQATAICHVTMSEYCGEKAAMTQ